MGVPANSVTLTPEQLTALNKRLSHMRHEVNNHLSLIVAAMELLRLKPEMKERMMETLSNQPSKITEEITRFSGDFEQTFGITRP